MKLKKLVLGIAASLLTFSLAACGSDAQKEFVEEMYSTSSKEFNAAKFNMSIKKLDYSGGSGDAAVRMVANQLKDMTIDGTYAFDEKAEAMEMEINLNLLGEKIPLQMVGEKEKFYISTSFVSGITNLATAFGVPFELSKSDLAQLEGKYLDIAETGDTLTSGKTKNNSDAIKNILPNDSKENKKYVSEMKKLIESFDKKTFTKEKDTLTHTFTKTEFIKMLELANDLLKEEKDYNKANYDSTMKETIKMLKEDVDKLNVKVSINQKNKATDVEFAFDIKDTTDKNANMSMVLALSMTPQKNNSKIKLPAKKDVITQDELSTIMNSLSGIAASSTSSSDANIDYNSDPELQAAIDEQLNVLIEGINENSANLDKAAADEIRKSGEQVFNAEQMKKLNDALDKALIK